MATFKAEVLKSQRKQDGTWNVKIRVTHNGKVRRLSTPWYVTKEEMTKGFKIKAQNVIDAVEQKIRIMRERFIALGVDSEGMSIERLMAVLTDNSPKADIPFFPWAEEFISTKKTKVNYRNAIVSFRSFVDLDTLTFQDITSKLVSRWYDSIREQRSGNGKFRSIKAIFNAGKMHYNDDDNGIIRIGHSPFDKVSLDKVLAAEKRAVSVEAVRLIARVSSDRHNSAINFTRDMFLLSFCLCGTNVADLYDMRCNPKDGWIEYERKKTRDCRDDRAFIRIRILDYIKPLVEKYADRMHKRTFCFYNRFPSHTAMDCSISKAMKKVKAAIIKMYKEEHADMKLADCDVVEILGIKNLVFYSARHSWATIARNELHSDKFDVHEGLNHVDKDTKITDVYIKKDFSSINEVNRKVVEYVFGVQ